MKRLRESSHRSRVTRHVLLPALLAVAAVYACSIVIAFTLVPLHPPLGIAVAADLTLTAAALFWLLAVRPGHAKPAALIRVLVLGLAAARLLVGLHALGVVAIAIEAAVTIMILVRARRMLRTIRALRREGHGLPAALDITFRAAIPVPAVASVLAGEVASVVLALTGWFRTAPSGFTMHRRSGYLLIIGVLCVLSVIEAVGLHLILIRVAPTLSIVLSALSAYGLLWLIGSAHAVRLAPLRCTPAGVLIERGVMRRVVVPRESIATATPIALAVSDAIDLSYTEPNVLLTLHTPVDVHGPFGRTRSSSKLLLSIDDRDAFLAQFAAQ
jgi:hypothetical protein